MLFLIARSKESLVWLLVHFEKFLVAPSIRSNSHMLRNGEICKLHHRTNILVFLILYACNFVFFFELGYDWFLCFILQIHPMDSRSRLPQRRSCAFNAMHSPYSRPRVRGCTHHVCRLINFQRLSTNLVEPGLTNLALWTTFLLRVLKTMVLQGPSVKLLPMSCH